MNLGNISVATKQLQQQYDCKSLGLEYKMKKRNEFVKSLNKKTSLEPLLKVNIKEEKTVVSTSENVLFPLARNILWSTHSHTLIYTGSPHHTTSQWLHMTQIANRDDLIACTPAFLSRMCPRMHKPSRDANQSVPAPYVSWSSAGWICCVAIYLLNGIDSHLHQPAGMMSFPSFYISQVNFSSSCVMAELCIVSNTGAPQGTIFSPFLFSHLSHGSEFCHLQDFHNSLEWGE